MKEMITVFTETRHGDKLRPSRSVSTLMARIRWTVERVNSRVLGDAKNRFDGFTVLTAATRGVSGSWLGSWLTSSTCHWPRQLCQRALKPHQSCHCQNIPLQRALTIFALLHLHPSSWSASRGWSWLISKPAYHPHWTSSNSPTARIGVHKSPSPQPFPTIPQ